MSRSHVMAEVRNLLLKNTSSSLLIIVPFCGCLACWCVQQRRGKCHTSKWTMQAADEDDVEGSDWSLAAAQDRVRQVTASSIANGVLWPLDRIFYASNPLPFACSPNHISVFLLPLHGVSYSPAPLTQTFPSFPHQQTTIRNMKDCME